MARKCFLGWGTILLSLLCLLSCGLEAFYYIDYIPDENVTMTDVYRAVITLPRGDSEGNGYSSPSNYFDNFVIFYRIYLSENNPVGIVDTDDKLRAINSVLANDFNAIFSTTDKKSTTVNTSNIETFFHNRRYYQIDIEDADISRVLGTGSLSSSSQARRLEIFFSAMTGVKPTLSLLQDDTVTAQYTLQRALSAPGMNFKVEPEDRYFLNHADMRDSTKANNEINADVAVNSATQSPLHAYISMYIAAAGKSFEMPPRPIFSQPTFIGVFKLVEAF